MIRMTYVFITALSFVTSLAHAVVKETTTMREVFQEITPHTFVVFDIDNTLIEPTQTLGSDQWFDANVKEIGLEKTAALWLKIQARTQVRAVESFTPSLIDDLQSQGFTVIGMTARPTEATDVTLRQLDSVGIDLNRTAPVTEFEIQGEKDRVRYQNGILFVGGNSKGSTLLNFFNHTGIQPARVVFTDDKTKHTLTVDSSLSTLGIEHVEFRYGAADERVKAYRPEIAAVQLKFFFEILDDASANLLAF